MWLVRFLLLQSVMFALLLLLLIRSLSDRPLMLNMCEVKQRVDESGGEGKGRDRQREEEAWGSSPALCCQRQSHFHFTPLGFPAHEPPRLSDRARLPVSKNQNTGSGSSSTTQTNRMKCLKLSISPELGGDAVGTPRGSVSRYRRRISLSTERPSSRHQRLRVSAD